MSEKEILEKTIEFLEVLGKKAGEMILSDQRVFLSRYGIGSIESLRKWRRAMDKTRIFIAGNVPSSKNSKQWTGKFLVMSKTCKRYIKASEEEYMIKRRKFLSLLQGKEKPYKIGFYFIRDSKRKFDYINAAQLPLDLMQKYEWLEDDDCNNVVPVFLGHEVDKSRSGVLIKVLD